MIERFYRWYSLRLGFSLVLLLLIFLFKVFKQLVACYEGRIVTLVFIFRFRVRINKVSADNVFVIVFRVSGFIKRFGVGVTVIAVRRIAFAVSSAGGFF